MTWWGVLVIEAGILLLAATIIALTMVPELKRYVRMEKM